MDTGLDNDELLTSLPIHLTNSLGADAQLHQFPLLTRPLEVPPTAARSGKRISARIRPNARRIEIHVPADTRPEVWSVEKAKELGAARLDDDREKNQEPKLKMREGEEPRLSEIRLRSEEISHRNVYMLGIVRDGKLHLHPVSETHQFRPALTYLDVLSRRNKRGSGNDSDSDDGPPPDPDDPAPVVVAKKEKKAAGEAKEVQVSAKRADDKSGFSMGGMSVVRREMLQILRNEDDEAWEALEFCDVATDASGNVFESVFSTSDELLQCKSNITTFIQDIKGL